MNSNGTYQIHNNDSSDVTLNIRYPGQYYDEETGLHYNWHRTYDPNTGRYLQRDLIGLADGPNPYCYVSQNPLNFFYFTGLQLQMPTAPPKGMCMITLRDGTLRFYPCENPPPPDETKKKCPECPKPPELNDPPPDAPHTEPPVKTKNNPNSPTSTPHIPGISDDAPFGPNRSECENARDGSIKDLAVGYWLFKFVRLTSIPGALISAVELIDSAGGANDAWKAAGICANPENR